MNPKRVPYGLGVGNGTVTLYGNFKINLVSLRHSGTQISLLITVVDGTTFEVEAAIYHGKRYN